MEKSLSLAGPEALTVDSFLKTVLRSGLVDRPQLQEVLRSLPPPRQSDPKAVADSLVRTGKLSRFQARKLLQGAILGLLLGPYQVLAPIGKGGMSTVYLARDSRSQLLVALKVLPPKRARAKDRMLARFLREMDMCKRVGHPHVAWTFEAGVHQGTYYIAMEFIPGKSLYRLVMDQGPLDVPRAARLFAEAALGLEHAHGKGLIHRDLKPSNILITPNDHAKVLDLGLALMQGELPADRTIVGGQGYVVGTMDYLAPEQAEDATKVDVRSDIYGLGCTLYFTLTGQPPFPGGKTLEKIARHRKEEPIPLEVQNPRVPPAFAEVVRKMMAKRPERRFASAAALHQALLPWARQVAALPLDQVGDRNYQKAMAALQAEDAWSEVTEPGVSGPFSAMNRRRGRPLLRTLLHSVRSPAQSPPAWVLFLVPLLFGGLLLLGLGTVILWLLLH